MIEKISYEDMISYSKELKASADAINDLIKDKDYSQLNDFVDNVYKYANYLSSIVNLNKKADEAVSFLKSKNSNKHSNALENIISSINT